MKVLYFGGQKSGKSNLAEKKALELCDGAMPYYIATYDNTYNDKQMNERVLKHQNSRTNSFITIEEICNIDLLIKQNNTYLIDCISMWILNNINQNEEFFINKLNNIALIDANIIFVLNDVSSGVIPIENLSRRFVDLSGIIGQKIASICNEVYEVKLGLDIKLK